MIRFLVAYSASAICLLCLDIIWLTLMISRLYQRNLGGLLADKVSLAPAVVFYVLYIAGVTGLAVLPSDDWQGAAARGALLGLVAFGTYDLTNQATLRTWPLVVTLVDLVWGTALTAAVALAGYAALAALGLSR